MNSPLCTYQTHIQSEKRKIKQEEEEEEEGGNPFGATIATPKPNLHYHYAKLTGMGKDGIAGALELRTDQQELRIDRAMEHRR